MDAWRQWELGVEVCVVDIKSVFEEFVSMVCQKLIIPFSGVTDPISFCCSLSSSTCSKKRYLRL